MASREDPYVVLLGSVGSGKSSIVERVTGTKARASNLRMSATKESKPLWSLKGEFIISDTPGSNAVGDKFNHNIWIASAFNFREVSKIFIVVKANLGRIDNVIEAIREYSDRFVDLRNAPLGVIVTNMDRIDWEPSENGPEDDLKTMIIDETDIKDVVFSSDSTTGATLIQKIQNVCGAPFNLKVDHDNFLRLFTGLHKMKPTDVLKECQAEEEKFRKKNEDFKRNQKPKYKDQELVDLVFEYRAHMKEEIIMAQMRVSDKFKFTFIGAEAESEAAHMSNMSNKMIAELRKIRIEALSAQSGHGLQNNLRKCPHCGQVWTKVQGCDGSTNCGTRPSDKNDLREGGSAVMATFSFTWNDKWLISKSGQKNVTNHLSSTGTSRVIGCGRQIVWKEMAPVRIPAEFAESCKVTMTDVDILPKSAENFNEVIDQRLDYYVGKMSLNSRPIPEESALDCVICLATKREVIILPCGHFCVCQACAQILQQRGDYCPVCRGRISSINRVFMS